MFVVCNSLHLFVFTSSTTIIFAFTFATNLSQPERPNLSIKGNPNPSTNHTNTSSKHPSLNLTFFYFQTLCLLSENGEQPPRAKKKVKTPKRKQGECSQAALKKLDMWFTGESKKNDYKMIYDVKNVGNEVHKHFVLCC